MGNQSCEGKHFSNKVYVSSDSGKILNLTKKMGAIPVKRPKTLSGDNVFKIEAIKHANDLIEKKTKKSSLIISLQANLQKLLQKILIRG